MSNNYALSIVYGGLAAGNQPSSDFDTTNGQLAAMGTLMCTAAGTNAITLTSLATYPTMTAYGNNQKIGFIAANTSTSAVTIQYSALGFLNAYLNDGVTQMGAGNITAGNYYELVYNSALNSSAGGWQQISSITIPNTRTRLTTNTTFYVSTTGNDSNTGLSIGSPWLTLQHAWNTLSNTYDLAGNTATVQLADGTYTSGLVATMGAVPPGGSIVFNGNSGTPSNVLISTTSASAFQASGSGVEFTIQNMKITTAVSGSSLLSEFNALIDVGIGVVFGACASPCLYALYHGVIVIANSYTINGNGGSSHYLADSGVIFIGSGVTVTLSGTPSFGGPFAEAADAGVIYANNGTFSGSATGTRYSVVANGVIQTAGGGANFFPGNSPGSTATGGQYV